MDLKLYNTLNRKIELFEPIKPQTVTMYHCGPTVYWTQHIGNLRGMTMGDLVVRTLRYFGYDVKHARNYTDVGHLTGDTIGDADTGEDRMEKGAKRENLTPQAIADKYIAVFDRDTKAMNLLEPTYKPRATEYIPQMIELVQELMAKGNAYATDLAIYFDISTFPSYARLSGQNMEQLAAGAGKAETSDPRKKHSADFALWFFKAGTHAHALQYWDSPFFSSSAQNGQGFPGWHIECSAMARTLLGKTIDIHMGGIEHIPIHHTNEIAQSEAANGALFTHYWLHNEHLLVNNQKMAKSEGTAYSLQEVIDNDFDPLALRYFFLGAHYRSKQNFTWDALRAAQQGLRELRGKTAECKIYVQPQTTDVSQQNELKQKFMNALANDINVPQSLAVAWETIKSPLSFAAKYELLIDFDRVLGLNLVESQTALLEMKNVPEEIQTLIAQRETARKNQDFASADALRKQIEQFGYLIEDTSEGIRVRAKNA